MIVQAYPMSTGTLPWNTSNFLKEHPEKSQNGLPDGEECLPCFTRLNDVEEHVLGIWDPA